MENLTIRETEILTHIASGQLDKQIAYDLGITWNTLKTRNTIIYQKLGVDNRTQAAIKAIQMGLVKVN